MEILTALLEIVLEVFFQMLLEYPLDRSLSRREQKKHLEDKRPLALFWLLLAVAMGAGIGWISAQLWSGPWPHSATGKVLFLAVSPFAVGVSSYFINRSRLRSGQDWRRPWLHAGCAALFAFALALTRHLTLS